MYRKPRKLFLRLLNNTVNGLRQPENMWRNFGLFSKSTYENIRLAMRGADVDYTSIPIGRGIILLAIPMVLEMLLESVFAIVDVFFVAKLGPDAVATVGLTDSVVTLVYAVAIGMAMAVTAMVSRRIGEKDPENASKTAFHAIVAGIVLSVPFTVAGFWFGSDILGLMGASDEVIETGSGFTRILLAGNVTIMLLFLINAVFRGAGDVIIAMRVLWLANGLNIILDPCLIFGLGPFPELGVTGAAIATTIGRGTGVLMQLWILFRGSGKIRLNISSMKFDVSIVARLFRVSMGGIMQYLVSTASWIGVVRIIALFGSTVLAGYTIAVRILIFTLLPSWGIAGAAATLVGQNLGAKRPDRAESAVWKVGVVNMIFLGSVSVIFIFFPHIMTRFFTEDPEIMAHANECLMYIAFGYMLIGYGMVLNQAFNGAGDTYTPTYINLFCYWIFQIPAAYFLAVTFSLEDKGVYIAIMLAESLLAVVSIIIFRRGKWRQKVV